MARPRPLWTAIVIPLLVGAIGLNTLMQRPRFAEIHTVDVVQLLGSGVCFGVALMAFFIWLREPRAGRSGQ